MFRKSRIGVVFVLLLCSMFFVGSHAMASITISYGHFNNVFDVAQLAGEVFHELLQERTGGEISVEIYPGTLTASPEEGLEFLQAGVVDIFVTSSGHIAGFHRDIQFLSLPYLFNNPRHYTVAKNSRPIQNILAGVEEATGMIVLGMWSDHNGLAIASTRPIYSIEDTAGMRLRCMQNPLFIDMYSAFGFEPTPTDWGEVYTSLQTGLVEANDLGVYGNYLFNFNEVVTSFAITDHFWSQFMVMINPRVIDGLSPEHQEIVEQSILEAIEIADQNLRAREDEFIEKAIADGMTVTYPDTSEFIAKAQAMYKDWFARYPHWEDWYNAIQYMDPFIRRTQAEIETPDFWQN